MGDVDMDRRGFLMRVVGCVVGSAVVPKVDADTEGRVEFARQVVNGRPVEVQILELDQAIKQRKKMLDIAEKIEKHQKDMVRLLDRQATKRV